MKKFINQEKRSFLVFCMVGIFCTGIDSIIFYALHTFIGYRLAMICGFFVSLGFNYILNLKFSFKVSPTVKNAIGFILAHLFNIFVVRMTLMWLFIRFLCLSDGIAFVPTLAISVITNFFVLKYVVKKF